MVSALILEVLACYSHMKWLASFMRIPLRLTLERLPFGKAAAGEGGASASSFCTSNLGRFVGCGLAVILCF